MIEHDATLLVLLRVTGFASTESIAARLKISTDVAHAQMRGHVRSGFVTRREGVRPGYLLSKAGRLAAEEHMQAELIDGGHHGTVESLYERFLPVNRAFLAVCSRWQLIDSTGAAPELNDHGDIAYDAAVLRSLVEVHSEAMALSGALGVTIARLGTYGPRLADAHSTFVAGNTDWFLSPLIESYHTVWMEWHQDLLASLGRKRADELPIHDERGPRRSD